MSVTGSITAHVAFAEDASTENLTAQATHALRVVQTLTSGTGNSACDLVWSDRRSAAGAADPIDLRGALTGALGSSVSMVEVRGFMIQNRSETTAKVLKVGAGSNPAYSGLFGATGDIIKVGPSGILLWTSPLDGNGLATSAGTADILTIDPSSDTIEYDIVVWGVSA